MTRALLTLSMLVVALATCGCAQATQIVLVVDSDVTWDTITVDVSSTHSAPSHASVDFMAAGHPSFPLTLAIYPRSSPDVDVFITVVGSRADGTQLERDVQTRFVSGSSRMLRVLLAMRCLARTCDVGETCDETGCREIAVPGPTLPEWTGSAPSLSGMAACAAIDELCNGEDDDCDMQADEDFDLATDAMNCGRCGTVCASGTCANGFCTGEQIAHLSAGGAHTCAASMLGTLTCWGWNDQDQTGDPEYETIATPTLVAGASAIAAVSAGGLHTCTVDRSGRCACVGDGQDGALGRGDTLDSSTLASVSGATTYASVTAGIGASCATDTMHTLRCWGANDQGQLGIGGVSPTSMPATMVLANVASVSMGFEHACAVLMSGELSCWGSNAAGQRGTGTSTGVGDPVLVPGVTDAMAVACGRDFTCFVHTGGTISCMGGNAHGQLGNGTTDPSGDPVPVSMISDATSLSTPSAGTHVCAVRSTGLIACWGGNASGQLGNGTTEDSNTPVMVPMPSDADEVAAGGLADDGTGHTCVRDHEGRVWCWGDGALGQLGTSDLLPRMRPTLVLGAM